MATGTATTWWISLIPVTVLTILLTLFARRIRRTRTSRPLVVQETAPTFQVVALGLQGSGKTLLLASMYHRLKTPAGQCYFLTATHDDVLQLNQWYIQMADTASSGAWPRGTAKGETRHFTFTVKTRINGTPHTILHLKYLEYAGELLTELQDAGSTKQKELFDHIDTADALIGVIDGYHIRQHLDGHPEGPIHLERTLNALLPIMIEASAPISFVITKWDLLVDLHPDESTRLSIVHNVLTSNDHFRSLVNLHSATRVVRLIPVSAVGPDFAKIDTTGEIVKNSDGTVHPTNVDVPLSAVVPDMFEQVESRLDRESITALRSEVRRRTQQSTLEALASLSTFAGQMAGRTLLAAFGPSAAVVGDSLLGFFLDSRMDAPSQEQMRLDQELSEAEQRIEQFRLARRRVLHDMRRKVDSLEGRLPHSRLSDGH
ncbi:hypothetical protein N5079_33405 [Planotetraspora sp. A-T 1434]|uniref:hypothetical protein n=1 Tax=Planotetraspora sp. A-T 1434 TaxID=2979219 RepID=UPI0021C0235F|nr:hypothetical protein [Planotetraspora sp. A-T 1434]MCT9935110.1 hypothetical protein [Planotetraspora sp. A-T 1434]